MKTLCISLCSLLLAAVGFAQGPPITVPSQKIVSPRSQITMNIGGINCTTAAGTNQFAVQSWSWGASNPVTIGGGGAGSGKASVSSLNVMKKFDACSPKLFQSVVAGSHFDAATLTQQDLDGNVLLTVNLTNVFVESWQLSSSNMDAAPTESISFAFEKVCVNEPSSSTKVCYNLVTAAGQ